jgi:DNA-binding response OmpR family regulator
MPTTDDDPSRRPGTPVTLLLVEDEEIVRNPLARILGAAGYEVLEARSGQEALDVIAARPALPALVIADVGLEGMSGVELLARLRTDGITIPALLISGLAEPDERGSAGVVRFLMKPFSGSELLAAIRGLLDTARPT